MIFSNTIRKVFNPSFIEDIQSKIRPSKINVGKELKNISTVQRFTQGETNLISNGFRFIDSESFIYQYLEIFQKEILAFKTNSRQPRIIDCGANIGVSVFFFKQLYPDSVISAFEPDPKIFEILKQNTKCLDAKGLTLYNSAVWNQKGTIAFQQNDSDGGKICSKGNTLVKTEKISDFLNEKVDLLKIDIEGAEKVVLPSIEEKLSNVDKLFLELHIQHDDFKLLEDACSILRRRNFRYKMETVGNVSFQSFDQIDLFEMQINIYAENEGP